MTVPWSDLTDDDLGAFLTDLGGHLAPGADVSIPVAGRIGTTPRSRRAVPRWLVAAAIVLVAVAAILAVAPAREAVARWLGIGAVRVERGEPAPSAAPSSTVTAGAVDLGSLDAQLPFDVRLLDPALGGAPLGAAVDPDVPSGLVEIRYPDVSLIEIASEPGGSPALGKIVGMDSRLAAVEVGGSPGFWITGAPHELAYLAPDGSVRHDTVRRAGNVLLWAEGAVTYRIEGAASLDAALELARSLR